MEEAKEAAKEAAKPKVSFGNGGGIKFGNLGGAPAAAPSTSGFTFGAPAAAPAAAAAPATTGFVFGSGVQPVKPAVAEVKKEEEKPSPFSGFSFFGGGEYMIVHNIVFGASLDLGNSDSGSIKTDTFFKIMVLYNIEVVQKSACYWKIFL